MQKRSVFVVMTLALSLGACGGGGDDTDDGEIRDIEASLSECTVKQAGHFYIASALGTSGDLASAGTSIENAVLLAVQEINEGGGIHGRRLGLVTCDTACDAEQGPRVAMEIAQTPEISGIVGPMCSTDTLSVAEQVAIPEGIVMITPSASAAVLSSLDDRPAGAEHGWVNRTIPSDAIQATVLARIAEREGIGSVFVPHRDEPYGNGLWQAFDGEFSGDTADVAFDPGAADAAAIVGQAMDFNPDAVLVTAFVENGAAIVNEAIAAGFSPQWMFPDGMRSTDVTAALSDPTVVMGAYGTSAGSPSGATFDGFAARYEEAIGEGPLVHAGKAYDGAYLFASAMELASDPEDRAQVRDALGRTASGETFAGSEWSTAVEAIEGGASEVDYDGATGDVDFDENGDVQSNVEEWSFDGDGNLTTESCWTPDGTEGC